MGEQDPSIRQIAQAVRNLIPSTAPDLRESVKWSNPVYEKRGKVAYISATDAYVTLGFFKGAAIANLRGRIEGTGKGMRHVKIRSLEDMDIDQLRTFVAEALELDAAGSG